MKKYKHIPTGTICEICGEMIYQIYEIDIDENNEILSEIIIWDQRKTCCAECYKYRNQRINRVTSGLENNSYVNPNHIHHEPTNKNYLFRR